MGRRPRKGRRVGGRRSRFRARPGSQAAARAAQLCLQGPISAPAGPRAPHRARSMTSCGTRGPGSKLSARGRAWFGPWEARSDVLPRLPECPCPPRCTLLALAAHPAPRTAAGSYRQPRGGATTRRIAAIAPGASQQVPFQGLAPRCCLRAPARALGRCWRPQVRLSSPYGMFHRRFQPSGGAAAPAAQERKRAADVFRLEKQRRGRRAARALRRGERLAVGAWGCVLVQVLLSRVCGLRCK